MSAVNRPVQHALVTVAASQTDAALVTAAPGYRIRCLGIWIHSASTSTWVLNSKPSGSGTAISPTVTGVANAQTILGFADTPVISSSKNEGLTATTGAGGNTTFALSYQVTI